MTDLEIRQNVEAELAYEPSLNDAAIGVGVLEGVVTLSGQVSSLPEMRVAEKAALRVFGVCAVANELDVDLPAAHLRSDEELAGIASKVLSWSAQVPAGAVKLRVERGRVTLLGEVDWQYEREAAEQAVVGLIGVKNILNEIRVKPTRQGDGVKAHMLAALHRSSVSDISGVQIDTRGDHIILHGSVPSWADRDEVVRIAWCAPGVHHVDCRVCVAPSMRHRGAVLAR